ncbi:hypothetical protein F2P81_009777 [Scophthalmus maximus]|uniref:Uncharacterized protein n=1 Tax=Scophthalmus maximus TaxID=52904 RepID=A0A6A4SSD1_SCOMX|nr:hypothetical protein F2P81_009777 [Scophthalmus maximus]
MRDDDGRPKCISCVRGTTGDSQSATINNQSLRTQRTRQQLHIRTTYCLSQLHKHSQDKRTGQMIVETFPLEGAKLRTRREAPTSREASKSSRSFERVAKLRTRRETPNASRSSERVAKLRQVAMRRNVSLCQFPVVNRLDRQL